MTSQDKITIYGPKDDATTLNPFPNVVFNCPRLWERRDQ
jgi:hypothetical protein